ncbi:LLM class F420-dependent oxidoreductase [Micromonospora sp. NBC_01796]|uniref:LLM class F420-dependent oxidoreductase n=1 Tax=Micromonospora sp. NBC_01796 TaxID=2975987 RepID=UPI002DDAA061|nr:LLM class F420-dependent oxidoreductase [Micromonospora sp. NBC_01796]WSA86954.1 LLM class F420-dependent oxidoreductase [Micromonospora sp. NBC_01796]
MRLVIFTEPQDGATYQDLLRVARHTSDCGFDGFFRSDHYLHMNGDGQPGPTDAWLTLAGLALQTERIRLGTLVTSATFRLPGPLAISVAQVDEMSGGRVELGLGTGWFEAEHRAYGIPFPPLKERFDRLTEQLEVITGLWGTPPGDTFTYRGGYYDLYDSPAMPKPVQHPGPPVIVGGTGLKRTPVLAARFADEYNVPFQSAQAAAKNFAAVVEACERIGRDAAGRAPLTLSAAVTVVCGRNDAEVRRRADAIGRDLDELRTGPGVVGTPDEVVEQLHEYAKGGASRFFLQFLDLADLDQLDLIAAEVAPQL